jgi:hypothetical protein
MTAPSAATILVGCLVLHLYPRVNGKANEDTKGVVELVEKPSNESQFQIAVKSSDGDNTDNSYVMAVLHIIKADLNDSFDAVGSAFVDFSSRYTSDLTYFLKAMRNCLTDHSISLNRRLPPFEASELMDIKFLFNRRTEGKDGISNLENRDVVRRA